MRSMREQNQASAATNKQLQVAMQKVESQAAHWQNLWRSAAASNAQLTQRVALLQDALHAGGTAAPPAMPAITVRPLTIYLLCFCLSHNMLCA